MDLKLFKVSQPISDVHLTISGSKSESNRWLILQALYDQLQIENLSDSDDSEYLQRVLCSKENILDIGHAGTAMRFGTAFFASQQGREITLTGSNRMKQRPIGILVEALKDLGAEITYLENEGFPPLKIIGKTLKGGHLSIDGSISSQFLTALLLVAPSFKNGLTINVYNEITSRPYLEMTMTILKQIGVEVSSKTAATSQSQIPEGNITVLPLSQIAVTTAVVESDWSSAGYWYSWVALQEFGYQLQISFYHKNSLQGDSKLADIYKLLGVTTTFTNHGIQLVKIQSKLPESIALDLTGQPDQAQTIFATCIGLGINAHLTGLHTLKIKETDRLEAMKVVGSRFRESKITTTNHSIKLQFDTATAFNKEVVVDTFQDHRMAMAFAPLCMKTAVIIKDALVVTKSYKNFYNDLKSLNVTSTEI
jgi:3-phosphoshikimate 1-carboxyvinyltransferase